MTRVRVRWIAPHDIRRICPSTWDATNISGTGTALECGCQCPDRAMREGTSLGVETGLMVAGTAQAHSRAADSRREDVAATSFAGGSSKRVAHAASAATAADCSGNSTTTAGASQRVGGAAEGAEDSEPQCTAITGKRPRASTVDTAYGAGIERSRGLRARRDTRTTTPAQVAARGRTLGGDISRLAVRPVGKRSSTERDGVWERGDGDASDAKRMYVCMRRMCEDIL